MLTLEQYNKWRGELVNIIDKAAKAAAELSPECSKLYVDLRNQLRNDRIKIQVVGKLLNGKSSLINALLGEEVLPVNDRPCTTMVTEVKFSPEKKRIVRSCEHDVTELYYPSQLLSNGVEIVDSPGFTNSQVHTSVILNYLMKADAAIFLFNATQPFTDSEQQTLEDILLPLGFNDLIMVANKIDMTRNRDKVKLYLQARAQQYTSNKKLFAVSAKEAMDGIKNGDNALMQQSGMPEFTEFLVDYLTRRKAQLKLNKTAKQVANSLTTELLGNIIPTRLKALEADSYTLMEHMNAVLPKLAAVKAKRTRITNLLDNKIPLALMTIREAITCFFMKLESIIPQWIHDYRHTVDFGWVASKKNLEEVACQIVEHTKKKVQAEFDAWNESTLQPIMEEQLEYVFGDLKDKINGFAKDITTISVDLVTFWFWPQTLFIKTLIGALIGLLQGNEHRVNKLKTDISDYIVGELKKDGQVRVANILGQIRGTFEDIKVSVLKGLDTEIKTIEKQLKEMESICYADESEIQAKRNKLKKTNGELAAIVGQLDTLTKEVEEAC